MKVKDRLCRECGEEFQYDWDTTPFRWYCAVHLTKESLVSTMEKLGFRHTGEGAFWRRWPDGTLHNPDFVNEDKRVVIEYFGSYWHSPAEVEYAQQQWGEIGYGCLVLWDHERQEFLDSPERWGVA